jgi:hypothetical protein
VEDGQLRLDRAHSGDELRRVEVRDAGVGDEEIEPSDHLRQLAGGKPIICGEDDVPGTPQDLHDAGQQAGVVVGDHDTKRTHGSRPYLSVEEAALLSSSTNNFCRLSSAISYLRAVRDSESEASDANTERLRVLAR